MRSTSKRLFEHDWREAEQFAREVASELGIEYIGEAETKGE